MAGEGGNQGAQAAAGAILANLSDIDRIDALLEKQEKSIRDAFLAFVAAFAATGEKAPMRTIEALLHRRDVAGALKIVDSYVERMGNVLPRVIQAVGEDAAKELSELVAEAAASLPRLTSIEQPIGLLPAPPAPPALPAPGGAAPPAPPAPPAAPPPSPEGTVAVDFDPTNPRAAAIIRENRLQFVREMAAEQRRATTQALTRAMTNGAGPIETARAFRDSIGLTAYQENAVANYRRLLVARDRAALSRELRDRRSDRTVENAISRDKPLTEKQIDSMADRYRKNYRQMRAETIARTEGTTAASLARDESLQQMIDQTGIDTQRIEEIWNATRDKRTRDWHRSMNGQTVPHGGLFTDGLGNKLRRPGDPQSPAATRINCRCVKTFRIKPAA